MTATNVLVDIVKFFSENVAQDLNVDGPAVHPILQVDAIRFIYTFRYQVCDSRLGNGMALLNFAPV